MQFYKGELLEILISVVTISAAFATLFGKVQIGGINLAASMGYPMIFFIILVTVGTGFICHELMHRSVAIRFGCLARYRIWWGGLMLALLTAFISLTTSVGFVFAAPGAVYIYKRGLTKRENALISIAGPATNILLGAIFFGLIFVPGLSIVGMLGFQVNMFLAFFNLLPFPPLDGSKIFSWNPLIWFALIAIPFALLFL